MERRYSKEEEALEIQSLRRIISAYLNYSDASEKDVRRYEGSYKQLSPSHKALLSHLPLKFQRLRRCISMNTFFIMNMLQAFEPPLEMSQDTDIDEPVIVSGSNSSGPDTSSVRGMDSVTTNSLNRSNEKEEMHVESSSKSILDRSTASEYHTDYCAIQDNVMVTTNPAACHCDSNANGTVISTPRDWMDPSLQLHVPLVDVDKVRCIIRNIVRDWALEGEKERDQCYKPILEELSRLFPDRCKERPPSCLVPGAGLGRLAMDISCLGFVSQGNEFSYYMMICSSFILNQTQIAGEWTVYPWIHSNCNSFSDNDQLRPVSFPDIHPASAGITEGFSMCGGDFVEVYNDVSQEASWDAVVTCFFLDTAPNVVEYIEIIHKILKDGGVWINLGPLLYHFADTYGTNGEMSIELSLEDVKRVALQQGFELEVERIIETTYTTNHRSMMQNRYFAAFWTMKKRSKT